MTLYHGNKITTATDLRREKREWIASTFSVQDLKKKVVMTQEEIDKMIGETRYGETRYNKEYVQFYLIDIKNWSSI